MSVKDGVAYRNYNPDTGRLESLFREHVRDLLGLAWDARDRTILDEIQRLKKLDNEKTLISIAAEAVETINADELERHAAARRTDAR